MSTYENIVVVGASLAGLRAVQTLREEGYTESITLVGAEPHLPYNRPPLSKSVLAGDDDVALPGDEFDARWLGGRGAVGLDLATRTVALDDGSDLRFDGLVIATGARPRRLPGDRGDLAGVHVLRTVDDARRLRAAVQDGPERIVVIGGGFVGGEVASSLRAQGRTVTLVDAGPLPMIGTLGETAARHLADLHERHGVELVTGARVTALKGVDGRVRAVHLDDGRSLDADLVVAGLGVVPNTEWLDGSGLLVDDGVVTTPALFARHTPEGVAEGVVAAGDVARWPHAVFGDESVRIEHWANANAQGAVAVRNLLRGPAGAETFAEVSSLGMRVHGVRFQWSGLPRLADESRIVAGSAEEEAFAVAFARRGVVVGGVAVASPKAAIRLRKAVAARTPLSEM